MRPPISFTSCGLDCGFSAPGLAGVCSDCFCLIMTEPCSMSAEAKDLALPHSGATFSTRRGGRPRRMQNGTTMNSIRTGLLLAALTGLFLAVGWLIGGGPGMVIAFLIAVAMNFMAYWKADRMVLAMYRAQPVDRATAPRLYAIVEGLAQRANIPRGPSG